MEINNLQKTKELLPLVKIDTKFISRTVNAIPAGEVPQPAMKNAAVPARIP